MKPAAETVAAMLRVVDPAGLDRATPCQDWDLQALVHHVLGTTTGLAKIGRKEELGADPWAGPEITPDWNTVLADRLEALAAAWSDDDAWAGSVQLGSEMPAAAIGDMAYAEILLHGWDLARTVGRGAARHRGDGRGAAPDRRRDGGAGPADGRVRTRGRGGRRCLRPRPCPRCGGPRPALVSDGVTRSGRSPSGGLGVIEQSGGGSEVGEQNGHPPPWPDRGAGCRGRSGHRRDQVLKHTSRWLPAAAPVHRSGDRPRAEPTLLRSRPMSWITLSLHSTKISYSARSLPG